MHAHTLAFIERGKKHSLKLEKDIQLADNSLKPLKELKNTKLKIAIEHAEGIAQDFQHIFEKSTYIDNNFLEEIKKYENSYQGFLEMHKILEELANITNVPPQGVVSKHIKKMSDTARLINTYLDEIYKYIPQLKRQCAPEKIKLSRFLLLLRDPIPEIPSIWDRYDKLKFIVKIFIFEASAQLKKIEIELASAIKTNNEKIIKNKQYKIEALNQCINAAKTMNEAADRVLIEVKNNTSYRLYEIEEENREKIGDNWLVLNDMMGSLKQLKHVGFISSNMSSHKPSKTEILIKKFNDDVLETFPVFSLSLAKRL
jgi:hypothetical protein